MTKVLLLEEGGGGDFRLTNDPDPFAGGILPGQRIRLTAALQLRIKYRYVRLDISNRGIQVLTPTAGVQPAGRDVQSHQFRIDTLRIGELVLAEGFLATWFSPPAQLSQLWIELPMECSGADHVVVELTNLGAAPASFFAKLYLAAGGGGSRGRCADHAG